MAKNEDELIKETLTILIFNPENRSGVGRKIGINHIRTTEIFKKLISLGLIRRRTPSVPEYIITRQGIEYLLTEKVVILKYFHRLKIYDEYGRTLIEDFYTTRKKAELALHEYEKISQKTIPIEQFEITEIKVK